MSADDRRRMKRNKAHVRRLFEAGLYRHDMAVVDAILAPTFVGHAAPSFALAPLDAHAAYKDLSNRIWTSYADFKPETEILIAEGDWVATRTVWRGKYVDDSTWPEGRPFEVAFHSFHRFNAAGRLAEEWVEWDNLHTLRQYGLLPSDAQESMLSCGATSRPDPRDE